MPTTPDPPAAADDATRSLPRALRESDPLSHTVWASGSQSPSLPWMGLVAGGVWLVYLAPAAAQVVGGDWPAWQRVLGGVLLVGFVVLYLTTLMVVVPARVARSARQAGLEVTWPARGDREMTARTVGLAAIALGTSIGFGGEWLTTTAFVAAILAVVLDRPWPPRAIVGTAVLCEALLLVRGTDGDHSEFFWLGFAVLIAGFISYAQRRRGELEGELHRVREQNARLAVVDERNRIGRDLHDLLGHSLSVIAVKSQLAERLLERDEPERAAAEIRDVRGVARDALREVRHVVDGHRHRPLAAELASCAAALRSAEVDVRTESPTRPVAQDVEDVVSFVVREGTTNVLRHSAATRCLLAVRTDGSAVVALVEDDGPTSVARRVVPADPVARRPGDAAGHGLHGLAERLAAVGGTLEIGPGKDGGTALRATVPVRTADPAATAGGPTAPAEPSVPTTAAAPAAPTAPTTTAPTEPAAPTSAAAPIPDRDAAR